MAGRKAPSHGIPRPPARREPDAHDDLTVRTRVAADIAPSETGDAPAATTPVEELFSAVRAELERRPGDTRQRGGAAPVLGAGVVQELLRARPDGSRQPVPPEGVRIDKRR